MYSNYTPRLVTQYMLHMDHMIWSGLAEVGVFGFKPFDNFRVFGFFSFMFSLLFLGFSIQLIIII